MAGRTGMNPIFAGEGKLGVALLHFPVELVHRVPEIDGGHVSRLCELDDKIGALTQSSVDAPQTFNSGLHIFVVDGRSKINLPHLVGCERVGQLLDIFLITLDCLFLQDGGIRGGVGLGVEATVHIVHPSAQGDDGGVIRVNILVESTHHSGGVISGDAAVHERKVKRRKTGRIVEIDVGVVEAAGGDAVTDPTDLVLITKNRATLFFGFRR